MPTAAAPAVAAATTFHGAFFAAFVALFASCHSPHAFATRGDGVERLVLLGLLLLLHDRKPHWASPLFVDV